MDATNEEGPPDEELPTTPMDMEVVGVGASLLPPIPEGDDRGKVATEPGLAPPAADSN